VPEWAAFTYFTAVEEMDVEETDEMNGISGVLRFVQDAVAPQLLGNQVDLVEGGSQPAVAQGRLVPR
jgi:hypothetical protein